MMKDKDEDGICHLADYESGQKQSEDEAKHFLGLEIDDLCKLHLR